LSRLRADREEGPIDERPQFRVALLRPSKDAAVIELEGEVDIYSSPRFEEALSQGIGEGATRIVVDLAKVTFIDSTALGVIVGGVKGVQARGGSLSIVCRDENIRRIFEITGLDRILAIHRSREEALGAAE
jgi:anti-sigma B factor antagonist